MATLIFWDGTGCDVCLSGQFIENYRYFLNNCKVVLFMYVGKLLDGCWCLRYVFSALCLLHTKSEVLSIVICPTIEADCVYVNCGCKVIKIYLSQRRLLEQKVLVCLVNFELLIFRNVVDFEALSSTTTVMKRISQRRHSCRCNPSTRML